MISISWGACDGNRTLLVRICHCRRRSSKREGRDGVGWFLLALIISPLVALLLVLVMQKGGSPDVPRPPFTALSRREVRKWQQQRLSSGEPLEGRVRKCPYCAEFIKLEAIVCKHCGRDSATALSPPPANNTPYIPNTPEGKAPASTSRWRWDK